MKNVWERNTFKWYYRKPWKLPRLLFKHIKYSWQRITKGYCDKDLWSIDSWFIKIIPDMLQQFKETRKGSPGCLGQVYVDDKGITCNDICHEEWDKILEEMIFLFREMDEDECQRENPYREEHEKTRNEFEEKNGSFEVEKYREFCKDKAFALFSKWFYYLWD